MKSPPKDDERKQQEGRAFEEYIAQLYESLGFHVIVNSVVEGQQVDIMASKFNPGQGKDLLLIECKYRTNGSVSNQDVFDFMHFFESARQKARATKAVMVTNASFSPQAKLAADGKVVLLTQDDLESELFALKHVYLQIVNQYEQDSIFGEYITVDGCEPGTQRVYRNIEQLLCGMIGEKPNDVNFFSVLGDYGAGKSTLVQRLRYQFAKRFLRGNTTLKPVLFELKDYQKYLDIGIFVANSLKHQFSCEIPLSLFWAELGRGGFLVLLDGFDEMLAQVDSTKRLAHFLELSPLLASGSPVLLTCRPAYFVTNEEYERAVATIKSAQGTVDMQFARPHGRKQAEDQEDIDRLYASLHRKYVDQRSRIPPATLKAFSVQLNGFSEEQIDQYLRVFNSEFLAKCQRNAAEVKAELLAIYDLRDLMRKPILLSMMKDTVLLSGASFFEKTSLRNSAALYETYTDLNFDIDWSKGPTRHFLTKQQRADFAEAIALAMYDRKRLEVTYDEIIEVIRSNKDILKAGSEVAASASAEEVGTDLQLCTFITRTEAETFKFIHKSFMEFFVARFLKGHLSPAVDSRYKKENIPKEILAFIGCFAMLDSSLMRGLKIYQRYISGSAQKSTRRRESSAVLRRNLFGCILYSAPSHEGLRVGDLPVTDLDIVRTSIRNGRFDGTEFSRVTWLDSEFVKCELKGASFVESRMEKLRWTDVQGTLSLRKPSCVVDGEVVDSNLAFVSDGGVITGSAFKGTSLAITGSMDIEKSSFVGGALSLMSTEGLSRGVEMIECHFENAEIVGSGPDSSYCLSRRSTFYRCKIVNVCIDLSQIDTWERACFDCMGVLVIRQKADELPRSWQESELKNRGAQVLTGSLIVSLHADEPFDCSSRLELLAGKVDQSDLMRMRALARAGERVS